MPKPTALQHQNRPDELWSKYRKSTCSVERRRLQTVALLLEERSRREVIGVTKYARSSIADILRRYNAEGLQGLCDLRHQNNGRPGKLTDAQKIEIKTEIQRKIDDDFIWSGQELTNHIQDRYGLVVRNGSVYRLFSELGFSFQKPRPSHTKGDPEAQEEFKSKS